MSLSKRTLSWSVETKTRTRDLPIPRPCVHHWTLNPLQTVHILCDGVKMGKAGVIMFKQEKL